MNKAFVKESEDPHDRCPACGGKGTEVFPETIQAHLKLAADQRFSAGGFFCPSPSCSIAYFDQFETTAPVSDLRENVYPKDPNQPICACFGFGCRDIEDDISEGGVARTRAHVQRVKSEPTQCATKAADGQSCVAAVQRYYMQLREQ